MADPHRCCEFRRHLIFSIDRSGWKGLGAVSVAQQGSGRLGVVDLALRFVSLTNDFLSLFAGQTLFGFLLKLAQLLLLLGQIHWNNATASCTTLSGLSSPMERDG